MHYRYFVELSYNGAAFHGWQIQPNAVSVQQTLGKAFSDILRENITLTGCGRTDTGVHAKYFVAHFDTEKAIEDTQYLTYKLNGYLSYDIVVYSVSRVDGEAHARFSAIEREYEYHLITRKDPFLKERAYFHPQIPDIARMNQAAKILLDHTDFTSFSKLHTDVKTNNCKIKEALWTSEDEFYLVFRIRADRFLRNMVRAIVGTLLEVGKKRLDFKGFEQVILAKDRSKAGVSVPGHALFLSNVVYPKHIFIRQFD